jgi:hypothetical protein
MYDAHHFLCLLDKKRVESDVYKSLMMQQRVYWIGDFLEGTKQHQLSGVVS